MKRITDDPVVAAHRNRKKYRYGMAYRPIIVCLCGSTRFVEAFQEATLRETLDGKIVLSIGCNTKSDNELFAAMTNEEQTAVKAMLDELHLRKIDLADEVLILNVGGYIGESTSRELTYALEQGKAVRFLEPQPDLRNSLGSLAALDGAYALGLL